ncbi:Fructose-1,6-bisphosphatase class 1 [Thalassocella blandensis]|nr:Fructose-1,6-bisphosphatase class 1 [Thalassocella blandensis]
MSEPMTLIEFILHKQNEFPEATGDLTNLLGAIQLASKHVHRQINRAGLLDILGASGETNIQGEEQQKLDLFANERFKNALKARGHVCAIASEEEEHFIEFEQNEKGTSKYIVAIDPIDGSSNIDVNVPVGTIFSIYRRLSCTSESVVLSDFLQRGRVQVAAGYVIYGTSTMLVYTTGYGVNGFTFDATVGDFFLSHPNIHYPEKPNIFSINEGYTAYFDQGIRQYLDFCKEENSDYGRPYKARYVGSLVADFHRNLLQGGIYLYPGMRTATDGKLRLLYECNPLAFIAEQAGGKATNGHQRTLDVDPRQLHQRTPFFAGPSNMMEQLQEFLR